MKIEMTAFQFEEIIKKSYSLDLIFLLKIVEDNYDVETLCKSSAKITALHSTLIRKGLLSENGKAITITGNDLLKFAESEKDEKLVKRKPGESEFDKWWKSFPGTDTFTHKGIRFTGSRSLRQNKDDCRRKFNAILLEGDYTASQLIKALEYDITQKKNKSVETRTNKLTYLQNSMTYLNQRSYESFIELIDSGEAETPNIGGPTDI